MAKVEVKLGGKVLTFNPLTVEVYDRFLKKQFAGQSVIAERELVLSSALEPGPDDARKVFDRYPAVIRAVSKALVDGAEGPAVSATDDSVTFSGVVFGPPDLFTCEEMREKLGDDNTEKGSETRAFLVRLADKPEEASALFERFPSSISNVYTSVAKLAGADIEITVKKE